MKKFPVRFEEINGVVLFGVAVLVSLSIVLANTSPGYAENSAKATPTSVDEASAQEISISRYSALTLESDLEMTASTIWAAPVDDLDARQAVATFEHRAGYPPVGKISPDGQSVAFLVIPSTVTEQEARTGGGDVWVMDADGGNLRRIATGAAVLVAWRPDSRAVSYYAYTALEEPEDKNVHFQTNVYSVDLDGGAPALVYSDQTAYGVVPLGWSGDTQFLAGLVGLDGKWSILRVNLEDGTSAVAAEIPGTPIVPQLELSADGRYAAANTIDGRQAELILIDLQTGDVRSIDAAPLTEQSLSPFTAAWNQAGNGLLIYRQGDASGSDAELSALTGLTGLSEFNGEGEAVNSLGTLANGELTPIAWAPDQAWVAFRDYSTADLPITLQENTAGSRPVLLPRSSSADFVDFIGWLKP